MRVHVPTSRLVSFAPLLGALALAGCGADGVSHPVDESWLGLAAGVAYPAGDVGISALVARDVTGDGLVDVVVLARGQGARVLPGAGDGTFGASTLHAAGGDAIRVAVGDVDGDARQDLLVIGHFDNAFHVRRGLAGGGFAEPVRYPLRNHGRQILAADLNADGIDDVVAVHDGSGQPIWATAYLGVAGGPLRPAWEVATPYLVSRSVVRGDFDGDGRVDVAVPAGDQHTGMLLFLGTGGGQVASPLALPTAPTAPGAGDGSEGAATADLNGDGRDDLVVAHSEPARVSVRLGAAGGAGAVREIAAPAAIDVALGDVDGDGRVDAVLAHLERDEIAVLPGRGDGTFDDARYFAAGSIPTDVALADVDRDGRLDVLVTSVGAGRVLVLRNRGRGRAAGAGAR